jgi:transcription-repair coupling factor (superfamily II helicase)
VSLQGSSIRFSPIDLPESAQIRLKRLYDRSIYKQAVGTVSVPRPRSGGLGSDPLRDISLLQWCGEVLEQVLG